jgi:hypothetical protein
MAGCLLRYTKLRLFFVAQAYQRLINASTHKKIMMPAEINIFFIEWLGLQYFCK